MLTTSSITIALATSPLFYKRKKTRPILQHTFIQKATIFVTHSQELTLKSSDLRQAIRDFANLILQTLRKTL